MPDLPKVKAAEVEIGIQVVGPRSDTLASTCPQQPAVTTDDQHWTDNGGQT